MTSKTTKGSITNQPTTSEPSTYESSPEPEKRFDPAHTKVINVPARPRRMSAHAEADAARAIRRTSTWTPVYERRQSWNKEDHKHAMHLASIDGVKTGPGFSEQ